MQGLPATFLRVLFQLVNQCSLSCTWCALYQECCSVRVGLSISECTIEVSYNIFFAMEEHRSPPVARSYKRWLSPYDVHQFSFLDYEVRYTEVV